MQSFYGDVNKSRSELEQQSVDAGTTGEAVGFITYVQGLKKQTKQWEEQVKVFFATGCNSLTVLYKELVVIGSASS